MTQVVGFPTLMWRLMRRRVQEGTLDSVRPVSFVSIPRQNTTLTELHTSFRMSPLMPMLLLAGRPDTLQVENARAAMDLYRSHANEWESVIATGRWPSEIPPDTFSRCYT